MGFWESVNMDPNQYMNKCLHDVPDRILKPIYNELNQGAGWRDVVVQAEKLNRIFQMRDIQIAQISMAALTLGGVDTCSMRLIMELGGRGMTLQQLAQCLYMTKKFERSLLESQIKSPEPLEIVKQPYERKQVLERCELVLECEAVGFPYPRYTWFLGEIEVDRSNNGVLRVQRISKDQTGKYVCRVHNLHKKYVFSTPCTVVVEDNHNPEPDKQPLQHVAFPQTNPSPMLYHDFQLKIVEQPLELNVCKRFSHELRLECKATGRPSPAYQWYKDDQLLPEQPRNCLFIAQCKLKDTGQYKCVVSNGVHPSVTSQPVDVTIHDSNATESLDIVEHPKAQIMEEGAPTTLRCIANGRNGQLTYRWFHNQHEIDSKNGDYTAMKGDLMIDDLRTRHAGEYMCIVELHHSTTGHTLHTRTSKIAKIEVKLSTTNFKMPTAKYALLIGNSNYRNENYRLPAVINDLDRTKAVLEELDFKVLSFIDLTLEETHQAVKLFCTFIIEGAYAMLYFAGHGFAEHGNQYLMPCDAPHSPNSEECVCIDQIHTDVMAKKPAMCVIVKDVCHRACQNPNSSSRVEKTHVIPLKGNSYIMSAASLGEQAYETESGEKRGIFNKEFENVIRENPTSLPVKEMFNRILEKFREYAYKFGDRYPMHPEVKDNLMQYQRSLRDPIDNKHVDVDLRDQLAEKWRQYSGLPQYLPKIEAGGYGLILATSFQVKHSNWFVMQVRVEDMGKFESCSIELHNIPLELNGPAMQARQSRDGQQRRAFVFDVKDVQRLQCALEPELYVACKLQGQISQIQFSAPLKDSKLRRPLVSILQNWRRPPLTRIPTEGEDAHNSLEADIRPRNESNA